MGSVLDTRLGPADWERLTSTDLAGAACVVFDILRATSTAVTALAHGARALLPVGTLEEAVALHRQHPEWLLAGERGGLRPGPESTGGVAFHLGNSPREFTQERVQDRTIVFTTTNGSRALHACRHAPAVLAGALLNLTATVEAVRALRPDRVLLICAGTGPDPALEDVLAAGAFIELWSRANLESHLTDAASVAWRAWRGAGADLSGALQHSANARRLLALPELHDDVAWCLQHDRFRLTAWLDPDTDALIARPAPAGPHPPAPR
ncbi:MAG: 2-phosphosulfolactate phosphatase [Limisphaera sp.]|nr:2-phosphosulfolactate phosphatase [Limisphaera sp.]